MIQYGEKRYYKNPKTDDFKHTKAPLNIQIDKDYNYLPKNPISKFFAAFLYYIIVFPILGIYTKVRYHIKVKGRKNLKEIKTGYFMYSNHTNEFDAWTGQIFISRPKRCYIIANKDAVSIPFVRHLSKALGALPVPDSISAFKNLNKTLESLIKKKKCVMVYPEAHIWNYYTGLREFPSTSFRYAAQYKVPAVGIAVTYRYPKGICRWYHKPFVNIEILPPVYPKDELSIHDNEVYLRDTVYQQVLQKVSSKDNVAFYEYIQLKEEKAEEN